MDFKGHIYLFYLLILQRTHYKKIIKNTIPIINNYNTNLQIKVTLKGKNGKSLY